MLMSICQKAGQRHTIQLVNRSFEGEVKFKYSGTTLIDQTYMHEENKIRLNSGNACYHSDQKLLSYSVLSRNVNILL
jgi:hypothetical protein